ncbi:MAG: PIN domain-containing protein [Actinobacteria bacterium]|nr:PIN domain-containing protein [Actinomycetota bacterium]MBU1943096.1 PIN domain-containing protein [Actinomycetota bacterium]MBU2687957.1 PIN domain-containing protein [Actinomycetota bacterium]
MNEVPGDARSEPRSRLVLVDTSVWIESLRRNGAPSVVQEMKNLISARRVVITEPVLLELSGGARSVKDHERIQLLLNDLPEARVAPQTWQAANQNAFALARRGVHPPGIDILIATVAMSNRLELRHVDRHYERMAEVLPLRQRRAGAGSG